MHSTTCLRNISRRLARLAKVAMIITPLLGRDRENSETHGRNDGGEAIKRVGGTASCFLLISSSD